MPQLTFKQQLLLPALIAVFLVPTRSFAQLNIGFEASGGVSQINRSVQGGSQNGLEGSNGWWPSASLGINCEFPIGPVFAGAGAQVNHIKGLWIIANQYSGQSWSVDGSTKFSQHLSQVSIPLYARWQQQNFGIKVGARASYNAVSWSESEFKPHDSTTGQPRQYRDDDLNPTLFEAGPIIGLSWSFSDRYAIQGSYYHGLTSLTPATSQRGDIFVRQAQLGIRITLVSKAKPQAPN